MSALCSYNPFASNTRVFQLVNVDFNCDTPHLADQSLRQILRLEIHSRPICSSEAAHDCYLVCRKRVKHLPSYHRINLPPTSLSLNSRVMLEKKPVLTKLHSVLWCSRSNPAPPKGCCWRRKLSGLPGQWSPSAECRPTGWPSMIQRCPAGMPWWRGTRGYLLHPPPTAAQR